MVIAVRKKTKTRHKIPRQLDHHHSNQSTRTLSAAGGERTHKLVVRSSRILRLLVSLILIYKVHGSTRTRTIRKSWMTLDMRQARP